MSIPTADLRALVEKWNEKADVYKKRAQHFAKGGLASSAIEVNAIADLIYSHAADLEAFIVKMEAKENGNG